MLSGGTLTVNTFRKLCKCQKLLVNAHFQRPKLTISNRDMFQEKPSLNCINSKSLMKRPRMYQGIHLFVLSFATGGVVTHFWVAGTHFVSPNLKCSSTYRLPNCIFFLFVGRQLTEVMNHCFTTSNSFHLRMNT